MGRRMLLQSSSGSTTFVACTNITQPQAPLFYDFSSLANVSASGPVPTPTSCAVWNFTLDTTQPCITSGNGSVLVELWFTDSGQPMDRRRTVDAMYLLASVSSAPLVLVYPTGDIGVSGYSADLNRTTVFLDVSGVDDSLPWQRVLIPASKFLNSSSSSSSSSAVSTPSLPLFLTLVSALPLPATLGYTLRATCVTPDQLPCTRPGPALPGCNTTGGQGTCGAASSSGTRTCTCSPGWADPGCGTPVTNLTSLSLIPQPLSLPGHTWSYFTISAIAGAAETRMLVELAKPPGSASTYLPALMVSTSGLPGVSSIPTTAYSIGDACTCTSCSCYVPAQAQDLQYALRVSDLTSTVWYIGVFNSLGYSVSPASGAAPLTVTARVSYGGLSAAPPLCPANCSNQGVCTAPLSGSQAAITPSDGTKPASYTCTCNPGFGGPYCQGPLQLISVSGNNGFTSGQVILSPGQWQYYNLASFSSDTLATLDWVPNPASGSSMLLLFSPAYSFSTGDNYFYPPVTYVFNTTTGLAIPAAVSASGWMLGVLNYDAQAQVKGVYTLTIATSSTTSSGLSFTALLQMALIGSVSGLAIVFLCVMVARVVVMRHRGRRSGLLGGQGMGQELMQMAGHPETPPGVPPHIVATFPVFAYRTDTFDADRAKGRAQTAQQAAADAAAAAATGSPPASASSKPGGGGPAAAAPAAEDAAAGAANPAAPAPAAEDAAPAVNAEASDRLCSVCICDFEEGEMLCQLPCHHCFHRSCVYPWMEQHNTCPNCRWQLCPDVVVAAAAEQQQPSQQQQQQQGASEAVRHGQHQEQGPGLPDRAHDTSASPHGPAPWSQQEPGPTLTGTGLGVGPAPRGDRPPSGEPARVSGQPRRPHHYRNQVVPEVVASDGMVPPSSPVGDPTGSTEAAAPPSGSSAEPAAPTPSLGPAQWVRTSGGNGVSGDSGVRRSAGDPLDATPLPPPLPQQQSARLYDTLSSVSSGGSLNADLPPPPPPPGRVTSTVRRAEASGAAATAQPAGERTRSPL